MIPTEPTAAHGWQARLALRFADAGGKSVLAERVHSGPLRVQKTLYPEGPAPCHTIVLHPPGGIAGGDSLDIEIGMGQGAAALITTPGAGRWYRSAGPDARQRLQFTVRSHSVLEWLPQETIVFNGAKAQLLTTICLERSALYLGWEILCLGRAASGERFVGGALRQKTEIWQDGGRLWNEFALLNGGSPLLRSPTGMAGCAVTATLIAAGHNIGADLLAACREPAPDMDAPAHWGVTMLPRVFLARYLGHSTEQARQYFGALWSVLRPRLTGREARPPRIWRT